MLEIILKQPAIFYTTVLPFRKESLTIWAGVREGSLGFRVLRVSVTQYIGGKLDYGAGGI